MIEDLIDQLAETDHVQEQTVREFVETLREFAEACKRVDTDRRERQRIRDIADLIDADDLIYGQALAAIDRRDHDAALPLLRRCADAGIGESAWLLATVLEELGNPEAVVWYARAAREGDQRAEARLAELRTLPAPAPGEFPVARNGKSNPRALPAPSRPGAAGYVPPRSATEQALATIWAGVLGTDRVGIHDNFFEMGGNSIACLEAVSRTRQHGLNCTPRDFFLHQTIADLAPHVTKTAAREDSSHQPAPGDADGEPGGHIFIMTEGATEALCWCEGLLVSAALVTRSASC
jgi:hypothetical protein